MNVHGRDPLHVRHQLLEQLLLSQVVDTDVLLRGNKEERLGGMELDCLDAAFVLLERALSLSFAHAVNHHGTVVRVGANGCQVVTFVVPRELLEGVLGLVTNAKSVALVVPVIDIRLPPFNQRIRYNDN